MAAQDLSTLFEFLPLGAYRAALDGSTLRINRALARMNGYADEADMRQRLGPSLPNPYGDPSMRQVFQGQLFATGEVRNFEAQMIRHATGQTYWARENAHLVRDADGHPMFYEGTVEDISDQRLAQTALLQGKARLRATEAELQATLNALPDVLIEVSAQGIYRAMHCQDSRQLLMPVEDMLDRTIEAVIPADAAVVVRQAIEQAMATGRSNGLQYRLVIGDEPRWFELSMVRKPTEPGEESRLIAIARDITERKTITDAMAHLAYHDALTGLPNRRMLEDRLSRSLASSQRNRRWGALMFIDLDRFKLLNDTLGHAVGDQLLQQVARRLEQCVREVDTVARLGGDEFVVLLQDLSEEMSAARGAAETLGRKILASLNQSYDLGGTEHVSTPSIGVSMFRGDRHALRAVLQQADAAMYQAKSAGRNALHFHPAD